MIDVSESRLQKGSGGRCLYEYESRLGGGAVLRCVTHRGGHSAIILLSVNRGMGLETLVELLDLGMLRGEALTDARERKAGSS